MTMRTLVLAAFIYVVSPVANAFLSSAIVSSSWQTASTQSSTCEVLQLLCNNRPSSFQTKKSTNNRLATKLHEQSKRRETSQKTRGQQHRRTWEESFQLLLEFKEENGHCNVPFVCNQDPRLGIWVNNQRQAKKNSKMSEDRRAKLEKIGFSWNPQEDAWNDNYQKLRKYRETHGDCNVPYGWPNNDQSLSNATQRADSELSPALSQWVSRQRRRQGVLSIEQRNKLDAIGFMWENSKEVIHDKQWHAMLVKLKNYRRDHGNCHVPRNWSKDPSLGEWVMTQRSSYSQGLLANDRVEELNKLDFTWRLIRSKVVGNSRNDERHQELWLEKYAALEDFIAAYGHVNVPRSYNTTLFNWVINQRQLYRAGRLREDRKNMLEEIDFEWSVQVKQRDEQWLQKFSEYKSFVDSENPSAPTAGLQRWMQEQRVSHAKGRLKPERKALLHETGFEFAIGIPYMPH